MKTHIKRLTAADAQNCHALTQAVKWNNSLSECKRLIEWSGEGALGMYHRGAVLAATTFFFRYGTDRAWFGMVITHPKFQRQGLASQLMDTALTTLKRYGVREIMLDATPLGQPLYEKFRFRALYPVDIYMASPAEQENPTAERYQPAYLEEVLALDKHVFGADRSRVLKTLLETFPAWVDVQEGQVQGFIISKLKDNDSAHVGPWIHHTPQGAETLLRTALHNLQGRKVRLDVSSRHTIAQNLVRQYGAEKLRSCMRMIVGDGQPTIRHDLYYAKTMFATG